MITNQVIKDLLEYQTCLSEQARVKSNYSSDKRIKEFSNRKVSLKSFSEEINLLNNRAAFEIKKMNDLSKEMEVIEKEINDIMSENIDDNTDADQLEYAKKQLESYKQKTIDIEREMQKTIKTLEDIKYKSDYDYKEYNSLQKQQNDCKPLVESIIADANKKLTESSTKQKDLTNKIPVELLEVINRFTKSHPSLFNAVAYLKGRSCGGCGMGSDSDKLVLDVKNKGYAICDCGRIVIEKPKTE